MIRDLKNQTINSISAEQTKQAGEELASVLKSGDVLVLTGPLGAGKTTLIKGIAAGLKVAEDDIKSPSYTLINEYHGHVSLFHFDLYRMKETTELYEIGWDDYLMRDGIVVIEWGEKAGDFLPERRIEISIDLISTNRRKIEIICNNT